MTNIRVAGDAREHARRTEEEEATRLRKERLEQEAKSANEKFEEVIFMFYLRRWYLNIKVYLIKDC